MRHGLNIGDSIKTGDYISLLFIDPKYKLGRVQKCNAGVGKKKEKRAAFSARSAEMDTRHNILPGALKLVSTNLAWG